MLSDKREETNCKHMVQSLAKSLRVFLDQVIILFLIEIILDLLKLASREINNLFNIATKQLSEIMAAQTSLN